VSGARAVRWLWSGARSARLARLPLLPSAALYGAVMKLRAAAYRAGWRRIERLPLPVVAVGNLSVGGTGKTPLAAWIARYYAARGHRPGILLRGYGTDEPLVHQRLTPGAVVVANPDRGAGARAAGAGGADILVLDDAYQLLRVARDLNIVVLSAESVGQSVWPLPAGPWREGSDALARADLIVVTRRRVPAATATGFVDWLTRRCPGAPVCLAHLSVSHLEGMQSGARQETTVLAGRRVVAAAGIADPESFGAQLRAAGALLQLQVYQDHHPYSRADLERLVRAAAGGDYVVVTEKDAVKLRARWPASAPQPLVAVLAIRWERNGAALEQALDAVLAPAGRP
jgi:tetraacyldisaccharide 4'-kinase